MGTIWSGRRKDVFLGRFFSSYESHLCPYHHIRVGELDVVQARTVGGCQGHVGLGALLIRVRGLCVF